MSRTGRLESFGFEQILEEIRQHHWSGSLRLNFEKAEQREEAFFLFGDGQILTYYRTLARENLATDLIGFDFVPVDRMQAALRSMQEREERLEKILVDEGVFTEEALTEAYRQVLIKRLEFFATPISGTYVFYRNDGDTNDAATAELALPGDEIYVKQGLDPSILLEILVRSRQTVLEASFDRDLPDLALVPETIRDESEAAAIEVSVDLDEEIVGNLAEPPPSPGDAVDESFVDWTEDLGLAKAVFPSASGENLEILNLMLQELHDPDSQADVTLMLLRYASQVFQRGVLFKIEEGMLRSAGEFGFGAAEDDKAVEDIENLRLATQGAGIFSKALAEKRILKESLADGAREEAFFAIFHNHLPREVFIAPIFSRLDRSQAMAVFYGDQGPEAALAGKEMVIEIFLGQIALALEKRFLQERMEALKL